MLTNKFGYLYIQCDEYKSNEFLGENAKIKAIRWQLVADGATNLMYKKCRSTFGGKDYMIYFDYKGITYSVLLSLLLKTLDGKYTTFAERVYDLSKHKALF